MSHVLEVEDLTVEFRLPEGILRAPDGISFSVGEREVLGIVGESGSGKSVTALSLMGLIPSPPGKVKARKMEFMGKNLLKEAEEVRGKKISMVFQNPLNSLNPSMKIGAQLVEVLVNHMNMTKPEAKAKSIEIMKNLGIPSPENLMDRYPFEYSGGMRQRIMIAMAMLCNPKLLIADEPTTALDVTIQSQILYLFRELKEEFETSLIFITHDLGVIAQIADRVMVMYAGKQVENASVEEIFKNPKHPYTFGLLDSVPKLIPEKRKERLPSIKGNVPGLLEPPTGCRFHPRCSKAMKICAEKQPPVFSVGSSKVCCWLYGREVANNEAVGN
ncbi:MULTISPECIES: ABC transporter ATP-binding protein [unclassified Mesotoga]|uniref:ABC transporter ATP-binding protein n=1 Tax=unclassified Mesotoga TaxID=1184398 RepID=UPI000DA6D99C|nr:MULTISPECIES: ABC transporter ATP-binding protein [unclassified Mesotoga]PZC52432.1 peptide ABC transporter ATP-binding protein [Mesotoga sp. TolDC]